MDSRTPPVPPPGNRRRGRRRLPLALAGVAAALLSLGELAARPAVAQDGFCPVNLEQSDPCGGAGDGTDAGSAEAPPLPSVTLGNPVSLVTGAKRQRETDFALDGAPLAFHRYYDSANADVDVGLGPGWRHGLSVALFSRPDGGREIIESAGRHVLFDRVTHEDTGSTADVPVNRIRYHARLSSDGFVIEEAGFHTWHLPDGRTLRFQGSYLVRIDWPASASAAGGAPRFLSLYYRQRRLASVTDEAGRVLRLEHAPNRGALRDFDGPRAQPRAGYLAALVLPDGRRVTYGYDARGNLAEARFDDGTARTYHYEDPIWPYHLTGLTERTGTRLASWSYDERGRAVSSEHTGGVERVTLVFDAPVDRGEAVGHTGTTTVTDSLGARSVYTWRRHPASGASLLLSATGPGCATCPPTKRRYTYTEDARLATATRLDDDGRPLVERRYTWTEDGRLAALHEAVEGGVERLLERREYAEGTTRPVLVARPSVNGVGEHTVETTFDADGAPVSITERGHAPVVEAAVRDSTNGARNRTRAPDVPSAFRPIERTTRFAYTDGRLTTIDGPREDVDDVTRLEWHTDIPSRLVALHPPASPAIRLVEHDALGRPTAFRLGSASPWRVERDARGDVVRLTHRELVVTYTRDAEGRVTTIADTDGRTLHLEHDAAGRPERMVDDLGRVTRWLSDTEGRVTGRTLYGFDGSLVQSIERLHDAHGRLATEHENRAGTDGTPTTRSTTFEHDAAGRLVAAEDGASGARRTLAVDPLARLLTLTEPDGATTAIELDANGREHALTDARENRTVTWRDDFGRVVLLDSPDTGVTVTEHDAAGNPVRRTRRDGSVTTFAHDAADRLVTREDADGLTTWVYGDGTDDAGGTDGAGADGRLIATSNATTTERFAYDAEGQLVRHVRELGGDAFTTRYTRDGRGRLVDKHLPDGQTLRHHYHETGPDRGRLRAITRGRWFGLASETLIAEIDLDARDGTSGHVTHGGLSTRRRFTPAGELESIEIGQALRLDYRFDAAGRIVGIEENGAARRYDYTGGRLTRALTANATYTYRHDALGNRLARTVEDAGGARTERYRYTEPGRGNRLLSVVDESTGNETVYDYGAEGAPHRVGELSYTYDAHRRPVTLSRSGRPIARYAYNPFGERVAKTLYPANGGAPRTTYFLYDGSTLVAEIDGAIDEGAAEIAAQYVYLDGHRAVAKLEGRRAYAIHGDHLGTPLMMTDADGEIVWRAEHTPFGEARIGIEKVRLDLRLPGQYADAESGTHYNYFRDYDPDTGRYATSDPIGLAGGMNTYAYVDANPLLATDPLGLLEWTETARLDPEIQRQARRIGLTGALDDIQRSTLPSGFATKPAARIVSRAAPYLGLFALAYEAGYTGARLLDELIFQPEDQAVLLEAIRVYNPRYVDPQEPVNRGSLSRLAQELRNQQIGYLDDVGGACPADRDLYNETVRATQGTEGLIGQLLETRGFLSPEGIQFPSEEAYRAALLEFGAEGGEEGTGKTFRDWWAARLAGELSGAVGLPALGQAEAEHAVAKVSRVDHAARHLVDDGVIDGPAGSKATRIKFAELAVEIMTTPDHVVDHVQARGGQKVRVYIKMVDGRYLAVSVASEGRGKKLEKGDVVTAMVPSTQQLVNFGVSP